jgi:hypothetical protein
MHRRIIISAFAAVLLTVFSTGGASAQTVAVADPVGDSGNPNAQSLGSEKEQAYFDIVQARIATASGSFVMSMRLAGAIPAAPSNPKGADGFFLWVFAVDAQPGSIAGYPFSPGQERSFEYFILLTWDGTAFRASVIDRTPLVFGSQAVTSDIPFSFNNIRDEVEFVVDPALIGNPTAFKWLSVTALRKSHFGSTGLQPLDVAPQSGATNWPS